MRDNKSRLNLDELLSLGGLEKLLETDAYYMCPREDSGEDVNEYCGVLHKFKKNIEGCLRNIKDCPYNIKDNLSREWKVTLNTGKGSATKIPWIQIVNNDKNLCRSGTEGLYIAIFIEICDSDKKNELYVHSTIAFGSNTFKDKDKNKLEEGIRSIREILGLRSDEAILRYYCEKIKKAPKNINIEERWGKYIASVYTTRLIKDYENEAERLNRYDSIFRNIKNVANQYQKILTEYKNWANRMGVSVDKFVNDQLIMFLTEGPDTAIITKKENIKNKNLILYGPPGTGKTYSTILKSLEILGEEVVNHNYDELKFIFDEYRESGRVEMVTFHQSYGYEDFIEGIRPILYQNENIKENKTNSESNIRYKIHDGIFKKIARKALNNPYEPYVIIIDEINRGNVSKIFGELITLIEEDKRINPVNKGSGLKVKLPLSQEMFGVPNNLYIIGTMNTADRSITAIDTALRRRFVFEEMEPDLDFLENINVEGIDIKKVLHAINKRIEALYDREHRIGHAYFAKLNAHSSISELASIFEYSIIPLLGEYFFDDWGRIMMVLGDNQKQNKKLAFINRENINLSLLFGDESIIDDLAERSLYSINKEALYKAESYIGIYDPSVANF